MPAIDDLVASGLSQVQAQEIVDLQAGAATAADLASVGFSPVQVSELIAEKAGTSSAARLTSAGFWSGTQVPTIEANLTV